MNDYLSTIFNILVFLAIATILGATAYSCLNSKGNDNDYDFIKI